MSQPRVVRVDGILERADNDVVIGRIALSVNTKQNCHSSNLTTAPTDPTVDSKVVPATSQSLL